MHCEQCNIIYAQSDVEEMNIKQIQQMAQNFAKIGVCIVLLIGGEPFVRKDLPDIVKAFTDVGIHVRLQTNGLATAERLQQCVDAGAHDISISLDSLEGSVQDTINGGFKKSWERAMSTISKVNEIFPENSTAFFGTVLMPRNLYHIRDVIEFAQEIGWGVSIVPAHVTSKQNPLGFRTYDDSKVCEFTSNNYPDVRAVLDDIKNLKKVGYLVYDSEEYLEDIYRFVTGEPLEWRSRNYGICDSPNLYFAVEPNGNIQPCCDYKLDKFFPTYDKNFPDLYMKRIIHKYIYSFTRKCHGCLYGSYPEITVTARFYRHLIRRMRMFNYDCTSRLKKISDIEMVELAQSIFERNRSFRKNTEVH